MSEYARVVATHWILAHHKRSANNLLGSGYRRERVVAQISLAIDSRPGNEYPKQDILLAGDTGHRRIPPFHGWTFPEREQLVAKKAERLDAA